MPFDYNVEDAAKFADLILNNKPKQQIIPFPAVSSILSSK